MGDTCLGCRRAIPRAIVFCPHCHRERSHREIFPEQYEHPVVGKTVSVPEHGVVGTVERVVESRFGTMVHLVGNDPTFYRLTDCEVS